MTQEEIQAQKAKLADELFLAVGLFDTPANRAKFNLAYYAAFLGRYFDFKLYVQAEDFKPEFRQYTTGPVLIQFDNHA